MFKLKKIISIFVCMIMSLSLLSTNLFALEGFSNLLTKKDGIIKALHMIEPIKENYGLTSRDLEIMNVGNPIKTYEYTKNGISFLRNYYPLICDNVLVAWAIEDASDNEVLYQISTSYIDEVNKMLCDTKPFALIYDINCCYLFDGVCLQKLGNYEDVSSRLVLTEDVLNDTFVELNIIHDTHNLGYTDTTVTYGSVLPETTYMCDVSYVSQENISGVCWAATTACIVNYIKGASYTYMDVLKKCTDLCVDNYKMAREDIPKVFQRYNLSYQYKNYVPLISIIEKNIKNDYPMYASFYWGNSLNSPQGLHSGTIYGCTISNQSDLINCIYVMDPQNGKVVAQSTGSTYKYTDGTSGCLVWLISVSSRY